MYFGVNLKMEKPMLWCSFTWIVFIELNFIVAFLLIRKTWWGMGNFKKWGDPSNGVEDFEMGGVIPLYGLWQFFKSRYSWDICFLKFF